jgi:tetratricopeptide (TPR) repeat protein
MMGQYQEAITQYKKALRIAPNNIIAHLALAPQLSDKNLPNWPNNTGKAFPIWVRVM